jgi:hypothetical protein
MIKDQHSPVNIYQNGLMHKSARMEHVSATKSRKTKSKGVNVLII